VASLKRERAEKTRFRSGEEKWEGRGPGGETKGTTFKSFSTRFVVRKGVREKEIPYMHAYYIPWHSIKRPTNGSVRSCLCYDDLTAHTCSKSYALKVPSHQIRFAGKCYRWIGLDKYMVSGIRGW